MTSWIKKLLDEVNDVSNLANGYGEVTGTENLAKLRCAAGIYQMLANDLRRKVVWTADREQVRMVLSHAARLVAESGRSHSLAASGNCDLIVDQVHGP